LIEEGVTGMRASVVVVVDEVVAVAVVAAVVEGEDMMMITTDAGVTIMAALREGGGATMRIIVTREDVEVEGTMIDMTAMAVIIHHLEILMVGLRAMVCLLPNLRPLVPK
jgi:hypothetical protein